MTSVVIAAGGTGGHLVPALAIAEAIERADASARISFIGARKGYEREMIPTAGYRVHLTTVRPFARDVRGAVAALSLVPAVAQARRALRSEHADVVVGMGGYPSIPAVIAARMRGIPSVIHEQNAVPGLANEISARFTRNVAVTFDVTTQRLAGARVTGLPLRHSIASLDRAASRDEAMMFFGLDGARRTVLIFGGSIGAARLNAAATGLAELWCERHDVQLLLAAGRSQPAPELPGAARALPFIERMDLAYAAADVVVSRAGASTVCELAVAGVPSILVPYPHARRHEQHANARSLTDVGAAIMLDDAECTPARLDELLSPLLPDTERLARMSSAARHTARPHAAEEIAAWALELAHG